MRFTTLALCSSLIVVAASAHISTLNAASSSSSSLLLARSDVALSGSTLASEAGLQKRAEVVEEEAVEVAEDDGDGETVVEEEVDTIEARGKKHHKKAHHRSGKHSGGRRAHKKHHQHPHASHASQVHQDYASSGSFQGKGTFFSPDQGACGKWNTGADKIVALSADIYHGGAHCFEGVRICHGGKCVNAKVADMCPGCRPTSLDMSPSLFKELASPEVGVIDIQWSFV